MRESSAATRRRKKDTSGGEHPQGVEFCNETIWFGSRKLYCGRTKGHDMKQRHEAAVLVSWGQEE